MKRVFLMGILLIHWARAVEPLTVILPEGEFWCGQPISVSFELRGRGSFKGAAAFELPEIPQTHWVRMGNPVLGSEQVDGGEVLIQRHDFALVTQQEGVLQVPPVGVRFHVLSGGDTAEEVKETSEEMSIPVKRPPGVAPGTFVVTATRYRVEQRWSSQEDRIELGAIVTREVEQEVGGLSGMFLAPLPQSAPEGVRVYEPEQELLDRENRGDLTGKRKDRIRYRFERSGKVSLPAVSFQVWDPDSESLETFRIEGRTWKVQGPPIPLTGKGSWLRGMVSLFLVAGALVLGWRYRRWMMKLVPPRRHLPPLNPGQD